MPPLSSLAGILDSPVASSNGSTVMGHGSGQRTLPDISLGSLGSSFHSDDDYHERERKHDRRGDRDEGPGASRGEYHVTRCLLRTKYGRKKSEWSADVFSEPALHPRNVYATGQPACVGPAVGVAQHSAARRRCTPAIAIHASRERRERR